MPTPTAVSVSALRSVRPGRDRPAADVRPRGRSTIRPPSASLRVGGATKRRAARQETRPNDSLSTGGRPVPARQNNSLLPALSVIGAAALLLCVVSSVGPGNSSAKAVARPGGSAGAHRVTFPRSARVSVWGDSLTLEAEPALRAAGAQVHAYGGTSPCDWLPGFERSIEAERPTVVLLEFVGNHASDCMSGVGDEEDLIARYRSDLAEMLTVAAAHHSKVRFVVPPLPSPAELSSAFPRGNPAIGTMECQLAAAQPGGARCDTHARDLLSPQGIFTDTVGRKLVRAPDGVHLVGDGIRLYAEGMILGA